MNPLLPCTQNTSHPPTQFDCSRPWGGDQWETLCLSNRSCIQRLKPIHAYLMKDLQRVLSFLDSLSCGGDIKVVKNLDGILVVVDLFPKIVHLPSSCLLFPLPRLRSSICIFSIFSCSDVCLIISRISSSQLF